MTLRRLFGLEDKQDGGIGITVGRVTLPLDLMLELVVRQQSQLFSMLNGLQGQIAVGEQVMTNMGEHYAHLHDDIVQLQQNLEQAGKHPVERVDEQTERKERKPDEEKVH